MNDTDKDKIIALLRAEVQAWRDADTWRELPDYMAWRKLAIRYMACEPPDLTAKINALEAAMTTTDAAGALEDK